MYFKFYWRNVTQCWESSVFRKLQKLRPGGLFTMELQMAAGCVIQSAFLWRGGEVILWAYVGLWLLWVELLGSGAYVGRDYVSRLEVSPHLVDMTIHNSLVSLTADTTHALSDLCAPLALLKGLASPSATQWRLNDQRTSVTAGQEDARCTPGCSYTPMSSNLLPKHE